MRRLSDRARLEGMLALRKALDGVRRGPSAALAVGDEFVRSAFSERNAKPSAWSRRAGADRHDREPATRDHIARTESPSAALERDAELLERLDRIADSIERVAGQLDSHHQERAEHLDAIEFLLREIVIGTVPPTATRPIVLGGVIDQDAVDHGDHDISLVDDELMLEVDTAVEVRSRFHERWIGGFTIAESVNTPGRHRYRLTRRSDGIPLPILFEACDVRRAEAAFGKQHTPR